MRADETGRAGDENRLPAERRQIHSANSGRNPKIILLTVINCASWSFPHALGGNPATLSAWSTDRQTGCPTTAFGHDSGRHSHANKSANCARAEYKHGWHGLHRFAAVDRHRPRAA